MVRPMFSCRKNIYLAERRDLPKKASLDPLDCRVTLIQVANVFPVYKPVAIVSALVEGNSLLDVNGETRVSTVEKTPIFGAPKDHNVVRRHTLRVMPAVAVGIEETMWGGGDLSDTALEGA